MLSLICISGLVLSKFEFVDLLPFLLQDCWGTYVPAEKTVGTHMSSQF